MRNSLAIKMEIKSTYLSTESPCEGGLIKINLISILQICPNTNNLDHFIITFPPIILKAGVPLTKASRANTPPHSGHTQGVDV